MKRNHIIAIVVLVVGFLAFQAASQEYQRIQKRIETTQSKVDRVADESAAAIADIRRVIASIVDRFSQSVEVEKQFQTMVVSEVEKLRERVEQKSVEAPKKTTPKIVMHSGYSCGPCNDWIAKSLPNWKAKGWEVEVRKEIESTRSWPWFEVYLSDGKRFEVDGPLTIESYEKALATSRE
jgi:hypothetical protein